MGEEAKECQYCNCKDGTIEKRRMMCRYPDDEQNFMTSCLKCFEESEERWADLFEEYYAMIM